MRKTASLTSFITFVCLLITSIVLFIVPQGRIAYWANWKIFYLTKEQWTAVHINLGILFIISICFHIYFNWKAILLYLKNKARELKVFTREFNISLVIVLVFIFGTIADIPFFSTVIDLNDKIKDKAVLTYGEPPYGHAELSTLETFSKRMGFDLNQGIILLRNSGYEIKSGTATLKDIAEFNKTSPQNIYLALKKGADADFNQRTYQGSQNSSFSGKGRMSLDETAKELNISSKELAAYLESKGLKFDFSLSLRENAQLNNMRTFEFYDLLIKYSKKK